MHFRDFRVVLVFRVALLVATCFLIAHFWYRDSYDVSKLLAFGLLAYQVLALIKYLNKTNMELVQFLDSIQYDDFSRTYSSKKTGTSQDALYERLNAVVHRFRETRSDKEAQYQYFKTIVQHVGIGIITFKKNGDIQIINKTAKSLLSVDTIKNIDQLQPLSPDLVHILKELKTGGRDLIKVSKKGEDVHLSIYAIEMIRGNEQYKLISIQNIKSELDENEMDAWQNLIQVLTHEIMNSVTPISSLAATIESEMALKLQETNPLDHLTKDEISDFQMALHTIHKRSESLIKFVNDFRNLTRIPIPNKKTISVADTLYPILTLLKHDLAIGKVTTQVSITPPDLTILMDKDQIEQVLINLIKNAIQAFGENEENNKENELIISAGTDHYKRKFISIKDNGTGIDEDALEKIFIPFFTTKKSGSGIGLSLSKQIMRKHNGSIAVNTEVNVGTTFVLTFN